METETRLESRTRIMLFVDHPNIHGMGLDGGRIIKPKRLMELACARGKVIHPVMFTDIAKVERKRELDDWRSAGFLIQFCPRRGVHRKDPNSPNQLVGGKETVDFNIIEYAHRIIPIIEGQFEVILVTGDSDFVPFIETLHHVYELDVRLFYTVKSALNSAELKLNVLKECYALCDDDESSSDQKNMPLFQRLGRNSMEHRVLTPDDVDELNRISEMLVQCPSCPEEVPIGLWKAHPCHPNAPVMKLATNLSPTATQPDPVAEVARTHAQALLRIQQLDPDWYDAREQERFKIPRTGYEQIMTAIRKMPSELALYWLTWSGSMTHTPDEIAALRRLVERGESKAVFAWQQVLKRLFAEFATENGVKPLDAERQLAEWAGTYCFPNMLPLLVHQKVLLVQQGVLVRRLTHPVCDYTPFAPTGAPHAA